MRRTIVPLLLLLAAPALGRKPEDLYHGQVVITNKRFPVRFDSDGAFLAFLKQHRKEQIWPTADQKEWKFEFMSFFARPLRDFLVTMKLYDVSERKERFVVAYDENVAERGLRVLHSSITLGTPEFTPNRRYELRVTSRGLVLAKTKFVLRGHGPRYSGRVVFGDDEVR